jgi:hypothetical protein
VIDLYRYGAWSGQSTIVSTVVPAPATLLAAAAPFGLASLRRPRRAA